jgi:translation initiation factor IF-1
MTDNKDLIRTGVVMEALPNIMFKVRLDPVAGGHEQEAGGESQEILTYLSGKMRLHRIRVLVGDKVELELEPYGGKARITKRL